MRRAVLLVLDGLRRDMLNARLTPALMRIAETATTFPRHRSAFPSATRVVSATVATGCWPARHGLQGNTLVLLEDRRLVEHDVGKPGFFDHRRRIVGRALDMPTLAERVSGHGGATVFSNVSPGAAYAHDPDGFGHVYHRAGSFAPGRVPITGPDALDVTLDAAGDRRMTLRFLERLLSPGAAPVSVLWCGEPDHVQHNAPLGSPECDAALAAADENVSLVSAAVEQVRAGGDDVLFVVCSDHGHQTITGAVDVEGELAAAGFEVSPTGIVAASNGTAVLIYLHPDRRDVLPRLSAFLRAAPWAGCVVSADRLGEIGQAADHGLAFAVSMRDRDDANVHGAGGLSLVAKPRGEKLDRIGCGQHGGLGKAEQAPFMFVQGKGFTPGSSTRASAPVDIAPTILKHLQLPYSGMDGQALQCPTDAA
jgi:hypothetical protein